MVAGISHFALESENRSWKELILYSHQISHPFDDSTNYLAYTKIIGIKFACEQIKDGRKMPQVNENHCTWIESTTIRSLGISGLCQKHTGPG